MKDSSHWAVVSGPGGTIAFQQVDDFRPPVWPGSDVSTQIHLDFYVDGLAATEARVLAAGQARRGRRRQYELERQARADLTRQQRARAGREYAR